MTYEKNEKISLDSDGSDGLLHTSGRSQCSLLPPFILSAVHLEKGNANPNLGVGLHSSMMLLNYEW